MIGDMDLHEDDLTVVNVPPDGDLSDADELDDDATGPAEVREVPGTLEVHFNRDLDEPERETGNTFGTDSTMASVKRQRKKIASMVTRSPNYTWNMPSDSSTPPDPALAKTSWIYYLEVRRHGSSTGHQTI